MSESHNVPGPSEQSSLSIRLRQTLAGLLRGLGEKQIAAELCISQHTVHVYVKQLYERYKVHARSELLAIWVSRSVPPVAPALRSRRGRAATLANLKEARLRLAGELARLDQLIAAETGALAACERAVAGRRRRASRASGGRAPGACSSGPELC
jgi:DNA-binding CsgD family transcriptional regulator